MNTDLLGLGLTVDEEGIVRCSSVEPGTDVTISVELLELLLTEAFGLGLLATRPGPLS